MEQKQYTYLGGTKNPIYGLQKWRESQCMQVEVIHDDNLWLRASRGQKAYTAMPATGRAAAPTKSRFMMTCEK